MRRRRRVSGVGCRVSSRQYTALKEEWDLERQKFTAVRTELEAKLQDAQAKREQVEELAEAVEGLEEGGTSAGDEPMGEREEMMRRNLASLETELSALNRDVNILQRHWRTTFGLMQSAQKACKLVMEEAGLNLSEKAHLRCVLQGKGIALDLDEWLKSPQAHTSWSWGLAALQHPITDLCAHTSRHLGVGTSSYVIVEASEQLAPSRAPSPTRAAVVEEAHGEGGAIEGEGTDETRASSGEESLALVIATGAEQLERGEEEPPQTEEEPHAEFPFGDPNQQLQYFSCCRASEYLLGSIIPHAQVRRSILLSIGVHPPPAMLETPSHEQLDGRTRSSLALDTRAGSGLVQYRGWCEECGRREAQCWCATWRPTLECTSRRRGNRPRRNGWSQSARWWPLPLLVCPRPHPRRRRRRRRRRAPTVRRLTAPRRRRRRSLKQRRRRRWRRGRRSRRSSRILR